MEFFKKNGFRTLNGLGMLVYQAAISFNMWFGITLTKIDIEQALGICEKKYKIAITGRIGSGKSTLSKILIDLGYSVFESDYVVNKILNQKDLINEVEINFSSKIKGLIMKNGKINKESLSNFVFFEEVRIGKA